MLSENASVSSMPDVRRKFFKGNNVCFEPFFLSFYVGGLKRFAVKPPLLCVLMSPGLTGSSFFSLTAGQVLPPKDICDFIILDINYDIRNGYKSEWISAHILTTPETSVERNHDGEVL